jgi:hypothetical protein
VLCCCCCCSDCRLRLAPSKCLLPLLPRPFPWELTYDFHLSIHPSTTTPFYISSPITGSLVTALSGIQDWCSFDSAALSCPSFGSHCLGGVQSPRAPSTAKVRNLAVHREVVATPLALLSTCLPPIEQSLSPLRGPAALLHATHNIVLFRVLHLRPLCNQASSSLLDHVLGHGSGFNWHHSLPVSSPPSWT